MKGVPDCFYVLEVYLLVDMAMNTLILKTLPGFTVEMH